MILALNTMFITHTPSLFLYTPQKLAYEHAATQNHEVDYQS